MVRRRYRWRASKSNLGDDLLCLENQTNDLRAAAAANTHTHKRAAQQDKLEFEPINFGR